MSLSIGAATDHLVTIATTAVTNITVNGQPVVVSDGEPDELAFGMLVIGLSQPPPEPLGDAVGSYNFSPVGNRFAADDYVIPCYIDVRVSGTAQKIARDSAVAIFNAFHVLLTADTKLGGALPTGFAEIGDLTFTTANVGTVAEPGRRQFVSFGVHCQNLT